MGLPEIEFTGNLPSIEFTRNRKDLQYVSSHDIVLLNIPGRIEFSWTQPFQINFSFLFLLKTSKTQKLFDVF